MTDRYIAFANSPVGRRLVGAVGLPSPLRLERWQAGRVRPVDGPLVIGGSGALAEAVLPFAGKLTDAVFAAVEGQFELPRWTAEHSPRAKSVLFDASGLTRFEQLVALRDFFQPVLKGLDTCPKVVVLGRAPESLKDPVAASVQRSLEGFTRSLGKEIRRGGNVQLLYVGKGAEDQLEGALRFFLSPKSAYVSGQVIRLLPPTAPRSTTGASRWPASAHWSPAPPAALARPSRKPWRATARKWCCSTCRRPGRPSKASPRASAAVPWLSTSAPRTPGSNWWTRCLRASISSCTTPGSLATRPWRR